MWQGFDVLNYFLFTLSLFRMIAKRPVRTHCGKSSYWYSIQFKSLFCFMGLVLTDLSIWDKWKSRSYQCYSYHTLCLPQINYHICEDNRLLLKTVRKSYSSKVLNKGKRLKLPIEINIINMKRGILYCLNNNQSYLLCLSKGCKLCL